MPEKYEVYLAENAENDLDEIISYFSCELLERGVSKRISNELDNAILSLEEMPERCVLVDEDLIGINGLRRLIVGNYIIFFTINESFKKVMVIRVLNGRRDWINLV